jgi:predicted dinucleotide-binding enzyme
MNIAIIGAGRLGSVLGRKWNNTHNITYGVRNPRSEKYQKLATSGFAVDNVQNAVDNSDIIVLAIPASEVESVVKITEWLKDKVIIDVTNPISYPVPEGFTSIAEAIAAWSNSSKVVKTLNQTGSGNISNPIYDSISLETLICGDDEEAKAQVSILVEDLVMKTIDAGGLKNAFLLENLAKLWITLAFQQGLGTNYAFKILRRPSNG